MGFRFSWRVGATRNFDHRRVGDLNSRTEPVIEGAARPDRLSDQGADRPSLSRQGCLQLARDHDRRTIAGDKLKINARSREANPSHHAFNHHKSAGPAAELGRVGRLYHGELRIAPYSLFPLGARPLRSRAARRRSRGSRIPAAPGHSLPSAAPPRSSRPDRSGGSATTRSATVLPQRSVPPANWIRSASRPSSRSLRKSRAAFAISGAPRSALGTSRPPSLTILPSLSSISRRSSTPTASNPPGRAPASRKARGGENDGRERRASAAEPPGAVRMTRGCGAQSENSC